METLQAAAPAPVMAESVAGTPLREAVLGGRFFGAAHRAVADALAAFIADPAAGLASWFGPHGAARLIADDGALRGHLDRDIAAIDELIGEQVDAILHAPRLQRLEGAWRGLAWLLEGIDPAARVKVRLLPLTWNELCRDLERAAEFDQSHLFRHIYEQEFGIAGGEPYGLLVVDHEVRHTRATGAPSDDVTALSLLSAVAAAAFAPTVLGASPALLGVDWFEELAGTMDPAAVLRDDDHARWRGVASREDMRFLCVALPRVLARPPWGADPARIDRFRYREYAPHAADRVWMNAGFAFAAAVTRAFAAHSWPADVRGVESDRLGGGLVADLPCEPFATDPDHVWVRPSLDIVFTDRQERGLVDAGLMPLTALPFGTEAAFSAVRSLQVPAESFGGANAAAARENARLSAQINSMLCVSRFAHYVKVLGRDMVGLYATAEEIERRLQQWISGYTNTSINAGSDTRARYPLVASRVTVRERPGRPGVFGCVIHLQPHFQLDDVSATFRLVTEIAAPGRQN